MSQHVATVARTFFLNPRERERERERKKREREKKEREREELVRIEQKSCRVECTGDVWNVWVYVRW